MSESVVFLSLVDAEVGTALLDVLLAGEDLFDPLLDLGLSSCSMSISDEGGDPSLVRVDEPLEHILQ